MSVQVGRPLRRQGKRAALAFCGRIFTDQARSCALALHSLPAPPIFSALFSAFAILLASGLPASAQQKAPAGAQACFGCHTATPNVSPPEAIKSGSPTNEPVKQHQENAIPSLRGLSADALKRAMLEYRNEARPATIMNRIAKGFSETEIGLIADWIAAADQQPANGKRP